MSSQFHRFSFRGLVFVVFTFGATVGLRAESLRLVKIEPTALFPKVKTGELRQLVRVSIENPGAETAATVKIALPDYRPAVEEPLGMIAPGATMRDVLIPALDKPAELTFELFGQDAKRADDVKKIRLAPQRKWKIYCVSYSHHDLGFGNYPHRLRTDIRHANIERPLEFCRETDSWDEDSRFRFVIETSEPVTSFLSTHSESDAAELGRRIREGRIQIGAVHSTVNTEQLGHELLARLFYLTGRHTCDLLNVPPAKTGQIDDVVGLTWPLATMCKEAGVPYFFHGHNGCAECFLPASADAVFYWQGPGGNPENRVLVHTRPYGTNWDSINAADEAAIVKIIDEAVKKQWPYDSLISQDGTDFQLVTLENATKIHNWNARWAYPRLICATMDMFFDAIVAEADPAKIRADLAVLSSDPTKVYLSEPTQTATATAKISVSGVGLHLVDASYSGDGNYKSSVSGTATLWGVPPVTATTLTVSSGGAQVTSVLPRSVVTLSATVKVGVNPVTVGEVNFCDASASECTDIHLVGTAALSSSGTAAYKFVPGPGMHSYKAVFVPNGYGLTSASAVATLTVGPAATPVYSDTTAIAQSGSPGDYTLTATVTGVGGPATPTGSVSFLDTSFSDKVLATASLTPSTAGVGWLVSQTPALSADPIAEVTGDFNGDGIPDLALIWSNNSSNTTVTILFGKGDGTFTTGPTTQTQIPSPNLAYVIAGDFNGDGKMDLAVLSYSSTFEADCITTLLGNGDGTFSISATSPVYNQGSFGSFNTGSMIAADFNGDGKLDLAVIGDYLSAGGVSILLGNGDGTFTATGTNPEASQGFFLITTGDFNGDGIPDLAATNYYPPANVWIFLGNGDGTFTTTATPLSLYGLNNYTSSIMAGDFNGDGKLDLAISCQSDIMVFLGNGDGTFNQTTESPIVGGGQSLVAGDFNHDGKLDLAGIDPSYQRVDVFLGAGDGTFTLTTPFTVGNQTFNYPFALATADFNGDGVPDLAMLSNESSTTTILLTTPTQTATATVNSVAPLGTGNHLVEASYSGDTHYPASLSPTTSLTSGVAPPVISPAPGIF